MKMDKLQRALQVGEPANKRRMEVIVVGTGLTGARQPSLGVRVPGKSILFPGFSPPRTFNRGTGGINAAKNYQNDGDSVYRLFYDTIKGGDYRSREGNVYRLAEVSVNIIDQCVAQGVPFARRIRRFAE
jgi:succinate dehydrogenase / fumarate reductase flavoprotein subunit